MADMLKACQQYTTYIPDIFFVLLFVSVFLIAAVLEVTFVVFVFLEKEQLVLGLIFLLTAILTIVLVTALNKPSFGGNGQNLRILDRFRITKIILSLLRLDSLFLGAISLMAAFRKTREALPHAEESPLPVFHISEEDLSTMKIYFFFNTIFKCVPQFFVVSIFLLKNVSDDHKSSVTVGKALIFHNVIIFSLAMAILFPVRKRPRIFTTIATLFLNSLFKFMATTCACCLFLTAFTQTFKSIGYHALLLRLPRLFLAVWPSWKTMEPQCLSHKYSSLNLWTYGFFLCLVFSFIYIHPFSGRGHLFYHFMYFTYFLLDLFTLYAFTPAENEHSILLYSLAILLGGFASLFGLLNVFHKNENGS